MAREGEVASWLVPDLPLPEKPATNLRAQVGVGPGEIEAVRKVKVDESRGYFSPSFDIREGEDLSWYVDMLVYRLGKE